MNHSVRMWCIEESLAMLPCFEDIHIKQPLKSTFGKVEYSLIILLSLTMVFMEKHIVLVCNTILIPFTPKDPIIPDILIHINIERKIYILLMLFLQKHSKLISMTGTSLYCNNQTKKIVEWREKSARKAHSRTSTKLDPTHFVHNKIQTPYSDIVLILVIPSNFSMCLVCWIIAE